MRTFSFVCVCAAGFFWSLYMTRTKVVGMPVHNETAGIPDYATRVCHNAATSLPLSSILYPSIRRYTVQPTRKSETPVDGQSLKRKGGLLNNVLCSVHQITRTPLLPHLFEAFSFTLCSVSVSVLFVPKMVKGKGKKGNRSPVETGAIAMPSPQSPPKDSIVVQESEETPPPSRPPSPPPPPTLEIETDVKEDAGSDWSIEIEDLTEERVEQPTNPAKEKSRDRRRSSSWSRSLMNSFRRKKSKEAKGEELYKTGPPLPDDFPAKPENEEAEEAEEPGKEVIETGEAGETAELDEDLEIEIIDINTPAVSVQGETVKAEVSEKKTNRLSRMLSFGTFGRRKSVPVPQDDELKSDDLESEPKESTKTDVESKQEKKPETKSEAKAKSDMEGKHDEAEGESGQFHQPDEVKTKLDKKGKSKPEKKSKKIKKKKSHATAETDADSDDESSPKKSKKVVYTEDLSKSKPKSNHRSMFTFKSLSKSADHVKTEADVNAGQFPQQEITDPTSDTPNKNETLPAGVKPKRRTISSFFKREKSVKENETSTDSASIQEAAPTLRKGSGLRRSFGRRMKAKSTEAEPVETVAAEDSKKPPRKSTSATGFGSSFSLKKMFQTEQPPSASVDEHSTNKGILTKGGKRSSTSRPKSVQLDDNPQELEASASNVSGTELKSSRNTIGERFMTLRDSLRIKKRQRSKSVDQVVTVSADAEAVEISVDDDQVEEDENVTIPNAEVDAPPKNEIQANPVAETVVAEILPAPIDVDLSPKKHGILSAWFRILLLYCVHEAISGPVFDVDFRFVCILCLISCGFLVAANIT